MAVAYGDSEGIGGVSGFYAASWHEHVHHVGDLNFVSCACSDHGFFDGARGIFSDAEPCCARGEKACRAGMAEFHGAGRIIFHEGFFDGGLDWVIGSDEVCDGFENVFEADVEISFGMGPDHAVGDMAQFRAFHFHNAPTASDKAWV